MAINPISTYSQAKQAQQNPIGFGLNQAYNSSIASSKQPTGKTNIANSVRGYLSTGDFVGALVGFASNALSITSSKKNEDGSITRTTYATPFSIAGAVANPVGFLGATAYGAEMSRSSNYTATGHTNVANSILGGLVFGPMGILFGGIANIVGGLFGGGKKTDTNKVSTTNTFGSSTYTGFGSDKYGTKNGLGTNLGTVSKNNGINIAGYKGYGSDSYIGFGSDAYAKTLSSGSKSKNSTSNGLSSIARSSYSSYSSGNVSLHDIMGQVSSSDSSGGHNGASSGSASSGGGGESNSSSSASGGRGTGGSGAGYGRR